MTKVLANAKRRLSAVAGVALLVCALGVSAGAGQAQAEYGNFCNTYIPAGGTCHGGWLTGLVEVAASGSVGHLCVAAQGWNGSNYYNLTGWECGNAPVISFGALNGYPSIYNNAGVGQNIGGFAAWTG